MADFTRTWFDCSEDVLEQHKNIEIRQRYCFIFTLDRNIVIVSKNGKKWQFPGGHPRENEDWQDTLVREIYEETGLNIESKIEEVVGLGYYLIEENDGENYLQERYVLKLNLLADDLDLEPKESKDASTTLSTSDFDDIRFVKAVKVDDIEKYVPWVLGAEGWNSAVEGGVLR